MEVTNFTSPLQTVQMISMFTYLNTLSDFLFAQNFLNDTNQYQPIPVVNALYNYFFENLHANRNGIIEMRKINLARKLIEGTDLYGAKKDEILDGTFIDSLYKHIITTLVFEKYTNIYGFLAEVVRNSTDIKINALCEKIFFALSEATFLTENGMESKLEPLTIFKILQDFIFPLFPKTKREISLLSVDFVYAQAGALFHLSAKMPSLIKPTDYKHTEKDIDQEFNQYVSLGHALEQLAIRESIDRKSLRIFALPALLHYVYKQKQELKSQSIANIINNPIHETKAIRMLFSYLSQAFKEVEKIQRSSHFQFQVAMANFKNRTTLAREIIADKCRFGKNNNFADEVLYFMNHPDDYHCNTGNKTEKLENVNSLYQQQVDNITEKYFKYENQTIMDIFGLDLIKSMDADKVIISRGLIEYFYDGSEVIVTQLIKDSDDLFRFYFPDVEASSHYAIIRTSNNLTIIREIHGAISGCSSDHNSDALNNSITSLETPKNFVIQCDPETFREKLGLRRSQSFRSNHFPTVVKDETEKFDAFINKISDERANKFSKMLSQEGYEQTSKEWWKKLGLSLIPFYNCYEGIKTKNIEEAEMSCPMDALLALPFVGEVGYFAGRLTTAVAKSVSSSAETIFVSFALRTTMRETLAKLGTVLITEAPEYSSLFTNEFRNLGVSLFRLLDPGFELIYTIGKEGLGSIINLINALKSLPISFESTEKILLECESTLTNSMRKIETLSKMDVYVNSLTKQGGYGFKFIQLPDNRIVQLRRIQEYDENMPVVLYRDAGTNEIICRAMNIETGKIKKKILHLQDSHFLKSESPPREFRLKSFHDTQLCENSRFRRAPWTFFCLRKVLRNKRQQVEKAAMDFIRQNSELSEDIVRIQLKKFVFPGEGEMQLKFVQDWRELIRNGQTDLPSWSKKYEIHDPELFDRLRYATAMDKEVIPESEAITRISALHPPDLRHRSPISQVPLLLLFFENGRAHESVTFEDFLALRNYMGSGYRRIGENTIEAQRMREAFYRLAIRQSDDPVAEYATTLYRGETRPIEIVEKLFYSSNGEMQLNRFTSTTTSQEVAMRFQLGSTENVRVLYEMQFSKPYPRANLEKIVASNSEKETVLLPGSTFRIESVRFVTRNERRMLNVQMSFIHDRLSKSEWFKNIMDELAKLKKNGPTVYQTDLPRN